MGGIIGAGIFVNPSVVARQVHTPTLVLGAWLIGGVIALIGAFVYAELAVLQPRVGGQYAYLREAYHPIIAFLYGWTLLLVVQTGGMAGAAIIFGRYFRELSGLAIPEQVVAVVTLGVLTLINCFGIRSGSNVQSALMLMKLAAIALLIGVGWFVASPAATEVTLSVAAPGNEGWPAGLAAAMVPVLFAYGGWQTATFVSGEMRNPRRKPAARALHRSRWRYSPLSPGDLCLHACARYRGPGQHNRPGVRRYAPRLGRPRRKGHRMRDRALHRRFSQSEYSHCATSLLRDGA